MKLKFLILFVIFFALAGSAVFAQSMTDAQRQALIVQLQAQVAVLYQRVQQLLAQQGSNSWCYNFNSNLGWANSGTADVLNLHIALQKLGLSYYPDTGAVYNTGTSNALISFQQSHGLAQTGFFGVNTRAAFNSLYGCSSGSSSSSSNPNCSPSWQTGSWSACSGGQQFRSVIDSNNCGGTANRPALTQSCTVKQLDLQVNGSDGPVNLFLTLGNGANANLDSGITLNRAINLQWTGDNLASCTASDNNSPKIFSGYVPSSGNQSVTLTGDVSGGSYNNSVSDTFKISCVSTITGQQVSDSIAVNLYYNVTSNCTPYWNCTAWSACSWSQQSRTCTDTLGCGSETGRPSLTQSCTVCSENWQTGNWGTCTNGQQTRTVTDLNSCGTTTNKPTSTQTCSVTCTPNWTCADWSTCTGTHTRTCTDSNSCGTTANKPITSESCTVVQPAIALTSPTTATVWTIGSSQTISWTKTGTQSSTAELTISKSGVVVSGFNNLLIPNSGSYTFTVPLTWTSGNAYEVWIGSYTSPTDNPHTNSGLFSVIAGLSANTVKTPNIWVYSNQGGNVAKFNMSGVLLGSYSAGSYPNGIAVDASGNAWIANWTYASSGQSAPDANCAVTKLSSSGDLLGTYRVGKEPTSMAIDASGNVWVINRFDNSVTKLSSSGTAIGTYSVGGYAYGIAADASGNIWIANSTNVKKISSSGTVLATYSDLYNPYGIAVDASGNVWVTNANGGNVTKLNSSGTAIGTYSVGQYPQGIAVDASGNVWVGNYNDSTITELSSSGSLIGTYPVSGYPSSVAVDASGNIWVTNVGGHIADKNVSANLTKLSSSGVQLGSYEVSGFNGTGDFTGFGLQYFVLKYPLP